MSSVAVDRNQPHTRSFIEQQADELRRQNRLDSIPVDPLVLASRLGVSVYLSSFSDSGNIAYLNTSISRPQILVREDASPFRKRFAIAHTLARYLLHPLGQPHIWIRELDLYRQEVVDPADAEREHVVEANRFAVAMMMPERAVRTLWDELKSVEAMAKTFNVSEAAMGARIAALGLN